MKKVQTFYFKKINFLYLVLMKGNGFLEVIFNFMGL